MTVAITLIVVVLSLSLTGAFLFNYLTLSKLKREKENLRIRFRECKISAINHCNNLIDLEREILQNFASQNDRLKMGLGKLSAFINPADDESDEISDFNYNDVPTKQVLSTIGVILKSLQLIKANNLSSVPQEFINLFSDLEHLFDSLYIVQASFATKVSSSSVETSRRKVVKMENALEIMLSESKKE